MKNLVLKSLFFAMSFVAITLYGQNHALHFDGVNDKVGINDASVLNPTDEMTVEVWINADQWKSSIWAGTVIGKQATNPDRGYALTVGEGGKAEFTVAIGNQWVTAKSPAVMGINAWYHIAGVFDGTAVKLYINGMLQSTNQALGNINPANGTTLFLCDNPTWTGRNFDGKVDEVRIWNVARTEQEIIDNFTHEIDENETGLVGYWRFNEGSGNSTIDATGNNNNGVLLNMDLNSVWVDGFIPTTTDVGVVGIASPSKLGQGFSGSEKVAVEIKNFAITAATSFEVSYQINGGEVVTSTVNQTIEPFETFIYYFPNTVDLSGMESVNITAFTSLEGDGNNNNDTITDNISQSLEIQLFDNVRFNFGAFGQTNTRTFYMPESLHEYSSIKLYVDLNCPSSGCDPWDQFGRVALLKDGKKWELARFITPYKIACGGWEFDISDFRNLLTETAIFESFIQVWGSSGWLLDVKLVATPGVPEFNDIEITELWGVDNWVYGDPNISYDLPDTTINVRAETEQLKVRITNTGHGQGNTNNAAEFMQVDHILKVNDTELIHSVWKDDCDQNSCENQIGTWLYPRAGWCPGQDVQPQFFNLEEHYTAGESINLDYILHEYTNHQNTGYDDAGHTEPFLRIHAYLVSYANDETINIEKNEKLTQFNIYPNPTENKFKIDAFIDNSQRANVVVYDAMGKVCIAKELNSNGGFISEEFDLSGYKAGFYFVKLSTNENFNVKKLILK